jgi:hypothetical protein
MESQIKLGDLAGSGLGRYRSLGMFSFILLVDLDTSAIHGLSLAWALSIAFFGW